jgi:hypothetical protein
VRQGESIVAVSIVERAFAVRQAATSHLGRGFRRGRSRAARRSRAGQARAPHFSLRHGRRFAEIRRPQLVAVGEHDGAKDGVLSWRTLPASPARQQRQRPTSRRDIAAFLGGEARCKRLARSATSAATRGGMLIKR